MRNLRSLAHFSESYLKSFLKSYWARPLVAAAAVIVMLIPIGVAAAAPPLPEAKPSGFKRIDRALKQEATPARRLLSAPEPPPLFVPRCLAVTPGGASPERNSWR